MSASGNWWDNLDDSEKYKKLEADYAERLMKKYFSDKNIYGEKIYEKEAKIGDETIKAGRWHCVQSYADPVGFKEASGGASASAPIQCSKDPNAALAPISKAPIAALASENVQSPKDPNAALAPISKAPVPASASGHVQSPKDPNAALVTISKVPIAASASDHVQSFKDPNAALVSVPIQVCKSSKGFKDPNVVLGPIPVQSFKSTSKTGSSSSGKTFIKLKKKQQGLK